MIVLPLSGFGGAHLLRKSVPRDKKKLKQLAKRLNLFASCFNVGAVANRPRRLRVRTASNSDLDRSLWSTILDEISQQREQVCRCQLFCRCFQLGERPPPESAQHPGFFEAEKF